MEVEPQLNITSGTKYLKEIKGKINNDICKLTEAIFRVRDNAGKLVNYKIITPHEIMLRTGLVGDRSALLRIIDKGRQGGFSTYLGVESLLIGQYYPNTWQYYIATKEGQARDWLEQKVRQLAKDARLSPIDESRLIDIDEKRTSVLKVALKHFPKGFKKEIEYSYITGLAASPEGIRGPTAFNLMLDEFPQMKQRKDQQRLVYNAVRHFISQKLSQMTIQGTPVAKNDEFWKMYSHAKEYMLTPYYYPIIENWQELDLSKDIRTQDCKIPYFWTDLDKLEQARREDLDSFKQECLGVPFETATMFIPTELLQPRIMGQEKFYNDNNGVYKMAIDVAQKRDLTAITIGEMSGGILWERCIAETQARYVAGERSDIDQFKIIKDLCNRFKPVEILIDNTGIGVAIGDMIEADTSLPRLIRLEFASYVEQENRKERMPKFLATEFKRALIEERYNLIEHKIAEAHVLRVEKMVSSNGVEKFSGKRGGTRDDHFWSKCMLCYGFFYGGDVKNPVFSVGKPGHSMNSGKGRLEAGVAKLRSSPANEGGFLMW